jgi:hypothetical protein
MKSEDSSAEALLEVYLRASLIVFEQIFHCLLLAWSAALFLAKTS